MTKQQIDLLRFISDGSLVMETLGIRGIARLAGELRRLETAGLIRRGARSIRLTSAGRTACAEHRSAR